MLPWLISKQISWTEDQLCEYTSTPNKSSAMTLIVVTYYNYTGLPDYSQIPHPIATWIRDHLDTQLTQIYNMIIQLIINSLPSTWPWTFLQAIKVSLDLRLADLAEIFDPIFSELFSHNDVGVLSRSVCFLFYGISSFFLFTARECSSPSSDNFSLCRSIWKLIKIIVS